MPRWHFPWWYGVRFKWEKNDRNEKNDEGKKAECLDDTSPEDMEEGVSDKKITRVKIMMR